MFDIGFFELLIIMAISVIVIGPKNLPRLAKSIGKGWGEFQSTFNDLKKDVMDEGLRQSTDIDKLEQDIGAATKVDVDVNLSMNDINYDSKPSDQEKS